MPRNLTPDEIKSGAGKQVPEKGTSVVLTGAGMAGAGPNVGEAGWEFPSGTVTLPDYLLHQVSSSSASLKTHINAPANAHPAVAINVDDYPDVFYSGNVEGVLDELVGTVPPKPPAVGQAATWTGLTGIPDWGALKLSDSDLVERGLVTSTNNPEDIFPYFWVTPSPAIVQSGLVGFDVDGQDPHTDTLWNSGLSFLILEGAGPGYFFAGGFTRDGTSTGQEVMRTVVVGPRSNILSGAIPEQQETTLSGTVFPADRGVLALVHFPPGTPGTGPTPTDFQAQDLLDRCVAALLLGQGILGDKCKTWTGDGTCDDHVCDGHAGGIFTNGIDADDNYNPYAFPGRATGQYDLREIHLGVDNLDGAALKTPWNTTQQRTVGSTTPAAGQVRLGTDPYANDSGGNAPVQPYGIPILGGTGDAYTPTPIVDTHFGHRILGSTVVESALAIAAGGDNRANFFRYRLPYLEEYTDLKWTPRGATLATTKETFRYFTAAEPNDGSAMATAGNYGTPFSEDYWVWQIARYRHMFLMPSTEADGDPQEVGSYWLIHFKTEVDFEKFVRDAVMPWDAADGYSIYGASLVDTTNDDIENDGNVINEYTGAVVSPDGPAPDYGYSADSYHNLRDTVFLDPYPAMPTFTNTLSWEPQYTGVDSVLYVSGLAYFGAVNTTLGSANIIFTDLNVDSDAAGFWTYSYRTSPDTLTYGVPPVAPALISSPAPAFIEHYSFGRDDSPVLSTRGSILMDLGADPQVNLSAPGMSHAGRVEVPFTHMGSNAAGYFTDVNGPLHTNLVHIGLDLASDMECEGDVTYPSFSADAKMRVYFRRPIGHYSALTSAEPYVVADGHGLLLANNPSDTVLMHTSRWGTTSQTGSFSNRMVAGAPPRTGYATLFTAEKDTYERFLDEQYRYLTSWTAKGYATGAVALDPDDLVTGYVAHLVGPGMAGWIGGAIEVPVRAGLNNTWSTAWAGASWTPCEMHENHLEGTAYNTGEMQVAGWPDRNPPITDGITAPYPSTGILKYPNTNYIVGYRPESVVDVLPGGIQPDYSALSGTREYVRCFDVAFSNSATPVNAAGTSHVLFRIDGLKLEDFAFSAPGPGRTSGATGAYALMVKVPGLTTWMDLGRTDGAGPSKQDAFSDGAGCQVPGTGTFNAVDSETGLNYCQVKCHVGPVATLFESKGVYSTPLDEVPVLMKVMLPDDTNAQDYDFANEFDPITGLSMGFGNVGDSASVIRGICGIRIVRPS